LLPSSQLTFVFGIRQLQLVCSTLSLFLLPCPECLLPLLLSCCRNLSAPEIVMRHPCKTILQQKGFIPHCLIGRICIPSACMVDATTQDFMVLLCLGGLVCCWLTHVKPETSHHLCPTN